MAESSQKPGITGIEGCERLERKSLEQSRELSDTIMRWLEWVKERRDLAEQHNVHYLMIYAWEEVSKLVVDCLAHRHGSNHGINFKAAFELATFNPSRAHVILIHPDGREEDFFPLEYYEINYIDIENIIYLTPEEGTFYLEDRKIVMDYLKRSHSNVYERDADGRWVRRRYREPKSEPFWTSRTVMKKIVPLVILVALIYYFVG